MNNRKVKIVHRDEQQYLDFDLIENIDQLRIAIQSTFKKIPQNFDILLENHQGNSLTNEQIELIKTYDHNATLFIKEFKDEQMDIQSISSQLSKIELLDNRQNEDFKDQLNIEGLGRQKQDVFFEKESNRMAEERSFQSLKREQKKVEKVKQVLNKDVQCNGCFAFPIQGIIYKCLVCQDYDLCQQCQKQKHQFHPLLKIAKRGQYPTNLKVKFSKKSQLQMEKMAQADRLNEQRLKKMKYHGSAPGYQVIDPSTLPSKKVCQKNFVSEILSSID